MARGRRRIYTSGRAVISISVDRAIADEIKALGVSPSEIFRLGWEAYKDKNKVCNKEDLELLAKEFSYIIEKAKRGIKYTKKQFYPLYLSKLMVIENMYRKISITCDEFLEYVKREYGVEIVEG